MAEEYALMAPTTSPVFKRSFPILFSASEALRCSARSLALVDVDLDSLLFQKSSRSPELDGAPILRVLLPFDRQPRPAWPPSVSSPESSAPSAAAAEASSSSESASAAASASAAEAAAAAEASSASTAAAATSCSIAVLPFGRSPCLATSVSASFDSGFSGATAWLSNSASASPEAVASPSPSGSESSSIVIRVNSRDSARGTAAGDLLASAERSGSGASPSSSSMAILVKSSASPLFKSEVDLPFAEERRGSGSSPCQASSGAFETTLVASASASGVRSAPFRTGTSTTSSVLFSFSDSFFLRVVRTGSRALPF
mmetsp:Transcript_19365/g.73184  ORF Transcript_19365/g.73184 Transcript_19365/m.73184 type:complete len:315 (+) Transcript_19365:799-1743(+)